jgi:ketosteroid isomerase-like protein
LLSAAGISRILRVDTKMGGKEELQGEARQIFETALGVAEARDRGDREALFEAHYQGPEASTVLPGESYVRRGWPNVADALETRLAEFTYSRTTTEDPQVTLFGDWAILTYRQRVDGRLHDIDFVWKGLVTEVLIRRDGRWLILHHHASDSA